jgi:hypothetical protein
MPRSTCLLPTILLAAFVAAESDGAARREVVRVPCKADMATAPTPAPDAIAREIARRLIERRLGEDWDELIVVAADGDADMVLLRHGGAFRAHGHGRHAVKPPHADRRLDWAFEVSQDAAVREVEANHRAVHPGCRQMSIDILQSGGRSADQSLLLQPMLTGIAQPEGMDASGVVIAVVDTAIGAIPQLEGRLLTPIDVFHPRFDGTTQPGDGSDLLDPLGEHAQAVSGHGTAMASLVASMANGASILPVRAVRDDCTTTVFDLAEGILAAAEGGARVISLSVSTPHDNPILRRAVEDAQAQGILVVAAAGNDGVLEYPAAYPGVLAVTAVGDDGWPPAFAPVGARIDIAAPGVGIIAHGPDWDCELTGTSPATALVAGAAAAAVHALPDAGPDVWSMLVRNAVRPAASVHPSLAGKIGTGILQIPAPAP